MKKFTTLCVAASIAATLVSMSAVATELAVAPVKVNGEKVDSGLGDLPHYSQWTDPTGKNPVQVKVSAKRADKSAQSAAVRVSQAK